MMSQRGTGSRNRVTLLLSLIIQNQHPTRISDTTTGTTSGPSIAGTQPQKVAVHNESEFWRSPRTLCPILLELKPPILCSVPSLHEV
jgi:hypothetical protein